MLWVGAGGADWDGIAFEIGHDKLISNTAFSELNFQRKDADMKEEHDDDIVDDVLTGAYLITAIRHKIDRIGYVMKMEIVKNGLAKSIGTADDGVNDDIK